MHKELGGRCTDGSYRSQCSTEGLTAPSAKQAEAARRSWVRLALRLCAPGTPPKKGR